MYEFIFFIPPVSAQRCIDIFIIVWFVSYTLVPKTSSNINHIVSVMIEAVEDDSRHNYSLDLWQSKWKNQGEIKLCAGNVSMAISSFQDIQTFEKC